MLTLHKTPVPPTVAALSLWQRLKLAWQGRTHPEIDRDVKAAYAAHEKRRLRAIARLKRRTPS